MSDPPGQLLEELLDSGPSIAIVMELLRDAGGHLPERRGVQRPGRKHLLERGSDKIGDDWIHGKRLAPPSGGYCLQLLERNGSGACLPISGRLQDLLEKR